jgi:hypothetical protein
LDEPLLEPYPELEEPVLDEPPYPPLLEELDEEVAGAELEPYPWLEVVWL